MTELKPCPFCGGEAIVRGSIVTYDHVACRKCNSAMLGDTKEEAIAKWNNRPSPWHTGTPTEEGTYLVFIDNSFLNYVLVYWYNDVGWGIDNPSDVIAWQKITPFEDSKENK